jgi:hypothetical protein
MLREGTQKRISESMRLKINGTLEQILSGEFRESDVKDLLISLREYSGNQVIFEEIAHFIAHNARDRGVIARELQRVYFHLKYHFEYTLKGKKVKFDEPFPTYLLHLMQLQMETIDEDELKRATKLTKREARPRIESTFKEDKATKMAVLRPKARLTKNNAQLFEFLLTSLTTKPLFTQHDIISDLIRVMRYNGLTFDANAVWGLSDKIMLCILALIHHTEFDIGGHVSIGCFISSEVNTIIVGPQTPVEWFGNLQIIGQQIVEGPPELRLPFTLITTTLDAKTYCDSSMIIKPVMIDSLENVDSKVDLSKVIPTVIFSDSPLPPGDIQEIDFNPPVKISKDFKLVHTSGASPSPFVLRQ